MKENNERNILLFVDDEKICHSLLQLIIPNFTNFKLVSAFSGKEALELAQKYSDQLALILSDIMLPDINGYEIFNLINKNSNVPFMFQSGVAMQENMIKEKTGKNLQIIYKPYTQEELLESINLAINPDQCSA